MQTWNMPSNTYDMAHHGRGEVEVQVSPSLGIFLQWVWGFTPLKSVICELAPPESIMCK